MTETVASQLSDHLQHDHPVLSTDTKYKAVNFVETYTGRMFFPRDPKAADLSIIDIAHHLAQQCRYSGATEWPYSIAQHCCLLSDYVTGVLKGSPLDALQMLLHDGAEAYLLDVPRPIKQFLPDYRTWDHNIQMCIRAWIGLSEVPIPVWQDELDSRIIADERAQLMSDSGNDWQHDVEPLDIAIEQWGSRQSEQQFLMRYARYSHEAFGEHRYLRSGWGISTDSRYTPPFRTAGSDVAQRGERDRVITDLVEVDVLGGVGRVALRSPDGMMVRDTRAGSFPRPAWRWMHGKFDLTNSGDDNALDS
jgi:uncharacterized protein